MWRVVAPVVALFVLAGCTGAPDPEQAAPEQPAPAPKVAVVPVAFDGAVDARDDCIGPFCYGLEHEQRVGLRAHERLLGFDMTLEAGASPTDAQALTWRLTCRDDRGAACDGADGILAEVTGSPPLRLSSADVDVRPGTDLLHRILSADPDQPPFASVTPFDVTGTMTVARDPAYAVTLVEIAYEATGHTGFCGDPPDDDCGALSAMPGGEYLGPWEDPVVALELRVSWEEDVRARDTMEVDIWCEEDPIWAQQRSCPTDPPPLAFLNGEAKHLALSIPPGDVLRVIVASDLEDAPAWRLPYTISGNVTLSRLDGPA